MSAARSSRTIRLISSAAVLVLGLSLAGCSGAERLELGASAPLEAQAPLGVDLAVLSVTESSVEDSGLEGLFGNEIDGVPWLVGYSIELTDGTREDFSWDAITDLSSDKWVAETENIEVQSSIVNGASAGNLPCAEQGTEVAEPILMYGCKVFIVPEGQGIESVSVADIATWQAAQ